MSRAPQEPAFGRVPPHSIEAEEQLLSACLLDGTDIISRAIEGQVSGASFYVPAHRAVFNTLLALYNANKPTDLAVLAEELKTIGQFDAVGGYAQLTRISGLIPTTAGAAYFIEKVREMALLRDVIKACTSGVENAYGYTGGIHEFIDGVETDIFKVTQSRVGDGAKPASVAVKSAMECFRKMAENKGALTGVSSGLHDIDRVLFGFQKQEMTVLAGRPSCGKTALALNITEAVALPTRGQPPGAVLFFSLEMSSQLLGQRLLCARARVNSKMVRDGMIKNGSQDWGRLEQAEAEISASKIFIDDASSPTVMEIRAKARRVHVRNPLSMIVVDYLQLIAPMNAKVLREQQVAEASRGLKALAKELDIPVIVLSQLNRSADAESRKPRLSDLRESGAIEQDADVVMMLYRPKEEGDNFQVAAGVMELVIAKNRNGDVDDVRLAFQKQIVRFENYTDGPNYGGQQSYQSAPRVNAPTSKTDWKARKDAQRAAGGGF